MNRLSYWLLRPIYENKAQRDHDAKTAEELEEPETLLESIISGWV